MQECGLHHIERLGMPLADNISWGSGSDQEVARRVNSTDIFTIGCKLCFRRCASPLHATRRAALG
jgi:hypothetical protein